MKALLYISLVLFTSIFGYSQDELINVQLTKNVMHGGTPMSGVSTTMAYTFVATKRIEMVAISYEKKSLVLTKGDTLVVNLSSYRPYNFDTNQDGDVFKGPDPANAFTAYFRNGRLYVNTKMTAEFNLATTYTYKGKKHTAKIKTEVDESQSHYAP